jgi:hypothetical protein
MEDPLNGWDKGHKNRLLNSGFRGRELWEVNIREMLAGRTIEIKNIDSIFVLEDHILIALHDNIVVA